MKQRLNYTTLKKIRYDGYILENAPEKVMQFGEGNFLRAFADYYIDCANEHTGWNGKVAIIQPIEQGLSDRINEQEGLYTLYLRGREKEKDVDYKRIISAVSRCINPYVDFYSVMDLAKSPELEIIISNTTEAGIVYDKEDAFDQNPPGSFPAKLTRILYERFLAGLNGLIVLSCELIDNNGKILLDCVKKYIADWKLGENFEKWIENENIFCSTLVDRIVTGSVKDPEQISLMEDENGYEDRLLDVGEIFGVWIIEGPEILEEKLPFMKAGLNVKVVEDVTLYKQRKVRILNGAHTGFCTGAYLAGKNIVRECMENKTIAKFMEKMIYEEIIPGLQLDREDLEDFAAAVFDRFKNPFIDHQLLSICLNSTSKWKTRNMPSLLDYYKMTGNVPTCLAMSLAAYIAFYSFNIQSREEHALVCRRQSGELYRVLDDDWILDFYYEHRADDTKTLTKAVLDNERMWDGCLSSMKGLCDIVSDDLFLIREKGILEAYAACAGFEEEK